MARVSSHGVEVKIDPARLQDPRFAYSLARVSDELVPDERKLVYYGRMLDALFGDEGAYAIMSELAAANGGAVSPDLFNAFYADVMEQVGAKNS